MQHLYIAESSFRTYTLKVYKKRGFDTNCLSQCMFLMITEFKIYNLFLICLLKHVIAKISAKMMNILEPMLFQSIYS